MAITRANPHLEEIIQILDMHLEKHQGNTVKAREYLSKDDNEWIDDELLHCMRDSRYFISNYYAYRDEKEGFKGLYPLFDSQEILHIEYDRLAKEYGNIRALVLKARQMGITTYNSGRFLHATIFSEHINALIVAQDQGQSEYIDSMYRSALDFLPWWMRPRINTNQKGSILEFDEKDERVRAVRPGLKTTVYTDNARKPTGVGRGKCQVPWTFVWTDGGPITLQDFFDKHCANVDPKLDNEGGEWYVLTDPVHTWSFDGEAIGKRRITQLYRQRYEGTIQSVRLACGLNIEKTPEHRLLSGREWKATIAAGDYIDCIDSVEWFGHENPIEGFPELLAWQIAEGCENKWSSVCITQKSNETRERIAEVSERVTGKKPHVKSGEELKRSGSAGYVIINDPDYKAYLVSNGYKWGARSAQKVIPPFVFGWNKEAIAQFLRTFFEAEGSVTDRVSITSASKNVIESLRMMCAAYGVVLRVRPKIAYAANTERKTRRTYYKGEISGPSMRKFARTIGFLSSRKSEALTLLARESNGYTLSQLPRITAMFREACFAAKVPLKKIVGDSRFATTQNMSEKVARESLGRMKSIIKDLPRAYPSEVHYAYRQCDQKILAEWAERIEKELSAGLREERVEGVSDYEYSGYIYDLGVEGTHNYPTCGAITHNTFARAHLSELAFWDNGSQLSKSLFPTMNTPDGFYIMESTANGRNDFWHNLWRRAEAGKVDWHPVFIPFYRRSQTYSMPIRQGETFTLTKEELEMREKVLKEEKFLIKDETFKWMRNKKEEFAATDGDDAMFSQEYTSTPEESFQSSATMAFPRGIINKLAKRTREPKWVGEVNYDLERTRPVLRLHPLESGAEAPYPEDENRFHVWERPQQGAEYALGADVALGNPGGDYSVVQVVKKGGAHERDQQVAVWHGYIDPDAFAEIIVGIGFWYNDALVAVEVNSYGLATNFKVMHSFEYENIYRFKRLDQLKNPMTNYTGFMTTAKSKDALMAKMSGTLLDDDLDIADKFTLDEFRDFTEDGAEGDGAHDDLVMALMIAVYCAHEGEVRDRQEGRKRHTATTANRFDILDRFGTIIATTSHQAEAEMLSKKHIGSTIRRTAGATAKVTFGSKVYGVPADFQNTAFSPIHDKDGTASKLYYEEGHDAEAITYELIAEYEEMNEDAESDHSGEAWKYA